MNCYYKNTKEKNDYIADGNRELAARGDWGTDYYGHKTEGAFIKYYYNSTSGGWEAITKDGTKHYYGTTAASRQYDPADATRVFKWMIDRVEDANGNYITYSYTKDQGEIYLDRIDYTGVSSLSPVNYVKFYYDSIRTDAYPKFTSHFSVTTAKRLITIEVVSNGNMVRAYKLEYDADPQTPGSQYSSSTGRSVIYSVQQYGNNAIVDATGVVTGGTALPNTTFTWSEGGVGEYTGGSTYNSTLEYHTGTGGGTSFWHTGDFNGDGITDAAYVNNNYWYTYLRKPPFPDLLTSVNNGVGGTTTITYKPSSQYNNNVLPYIVQTVSSISIDDGNGNTSTTNYTYSGGHHDIADREFRGFEYVKSTDPAGTTSETWFKQDDIFKGLPYKTEIKDPSGNLYSRTEQTYSSTSPYTGVDFPYLSQRDDYVYDGTATARQTTTAFTYDAYGNITGKHLDGDTSETGPNNNTTTYEYDLFGRRTKVTGPLDSASTYGTVSYEYQDCGTANLRIITYSTEESGTANYLKSEVCLDGLERTIKTWEEGPDGKTIVQDIKYDTSGHVYRESLPYFEGIGSPKWKTYTYDPIGRVTQITTPDSTVVTTSYDKGTTTFIDANGHKKVEVKDVYGRLIKVEEYTGTTGSHALYATTTYEYNALGNLIKLTDTESNQTTMTYDTLGRKLTMNDPDMGSWSYSYDANGNLMSQTDAKSQTITFTYDALNRTTRKIYPVGSDTVYTYDETFSTNPTGRLTSLTDSTGNTKYYYDEQGRTVKTIKTVDTTSYTTETTYDALSRTTSVTYPDSKKVNYTYDTGGNLLTVTDDVGSGSTTYASYTGYNALGQIEGVTYGNGVDTAYTYNPNNSLLSTIDTDTSTGTALIDRSYTFDNIGSITNITDNIDGTNTQTFTYDALDRLITANSGNYGSLTYAYDKIGNFTSKRGITYAYSAKPHAVTATSNGKTYTYDANGNMTADTNRAITYNYDNKPSSITKGGQTAIFYYDGSGSRIKKLTGSSTTIYIGKLYEDTGGSITKYIFAGGTRIASKTSADTYYYHQDHLGSSSVITNSSGVKVEEIRYYPFGETFSDSSPSTTKHKYTSQELDIETGLYYYNARYYDPELGRFISADTIVPDPTNPQALNRYSYVLNNPLKYTDPSGHGWFKRLRKAVSRVFRSVKKIYSKPIFRIASAVVVGIYTGCASLTALGGEGLLAYGGAAIAGGGAGLLTYKSSGYSEGGGGSRSPGIINAGSSASLAPIGTVYYPRKEGAPDPDPSDLMPGLGGAVGKVNKSASGWLSKLFGLFSKGKRGIKFDIHPRVFKQLDDPRMGRLKGKLGADDLQKFANNPNAQRFKDLRVNNFGNTNVIQEIDGKLMRITTAGDQSIIISIGPIRTNQVNNLVSRGAYVPLE
ncbi:MAG: hypothetical protein NUV80_05980 [Candidatus Berkelbacteria bacterium]|nr:hypothetical protein [Candidatus Berkelbacteria bacterium]